MTETLLEPTTVYRIGRARARHAFVVGIDPAAKPAAVVVFTRCGIPFDGTEVAETGFVTCEGCSSS